jgi:hypothetical protein
VVVRPWAQRTQPFAQGQRRTRWVAGGRGPAEASRRPFAAGSLLAGGILLVAGSLLAGGILLLVGVVLRMLFVFKIIN